MALTITLPDEIARIVEEKVAAGGWETPADVVGAAILSMPAESEIDVAELRRLCEEGFASGDAGEFTIEDVKREARRIRAGRV